MLAIRNTIYILALKAQSNIRPHTLTYAIGLAIRPLAPDTVQLRDALRLICK